MDVRLRAASFLQQLALGIGVDLKRFVEADLLDSYRRALQDWAELGRHTDLTSRVDDLRFYRDRAERQAKVEIERELTAVEPVAKSFSAVMLTRASVLVQLGGWISRKARTTPKSTSAMSSIYCRCRHRWTGIRSSRFWMTLLIAFVRATGPVVLRRDERGRRFILERRSE